MILKYIIEENNILVKEYLELIGLSRNIRKKARVEDIIYINGEKGKNYFPLKKGDVLELKFDEQPNDEILTNDQPIDIVYEDDYILIINKQNDIVLTTKTILLTSVPFSRSPTKNSPIYLANININKKHIIATIPIILLAK